MGVHTMKPLLEQIYKGDLLEKIFTFLNIE